MVFPNALAFATGPWALLDGYELRALWPTLRRRLQCNMVTVLRHIQS